MVIMKLHWPLLTFPPINLWSLPQLTYIEYKELQKGSKVIYSCRIVDNPLYKLRSEN